MRLVLTASILWGACACAAEAQSVVVNDNILLQTFPAANFLEFHISKSADVRPGSICGCDTGIGMIYSDQTLSVTAVTADWGSDWFLTQPGDVFSAATIEAGVFPVLINNAPSPRGTGELSVGPNDFYFGVRTDTVYRPDRPNRRAYGWVHLRPVDGTLGMVGNVMSYESTGIIVGTTTLVPEPGTCPLALLALCFVRKRMR